MDKLEISDFSSQSYGRSFRPSAQGIRAESAKPKRRTKSAGSDGGLALEVLLGCAACAVLLYVALGGGTFDDTVDSVKRAVSFEVSVDDAMGTLQFVKDGAAEVFGWRAQYGMPIADITGFYEDSEGMLRVESAPNSDVLSCASGEVVDADEAFVRIQQGGTVIDYGNLAFVCVEKGQIVDRGEAIGRTGEDGTVELRVEKDGNPVDAADTIGIKEG